jgi:beta-aspartyl-peptidase (threonine type)
VWAKAAVDRLAAHSQNPSCSQYDDAHATAQWAVQHLAARVAGLGGIILLDAEGRVGHAYNTPRMAYAYLREGMGEAVFGI